MDSIRTLDFNARVIFVVMTERKKRLNIFFVSYFFFISFLLFELSDKISFEDFFFFYHGAI